MCHPAEGDALFRRHLGAGFPGLIVLLQGIPIGLPNGGDELVGESSVIALHRGGNFPQLLSVAEQA